MHRYFTANTFAASTRGLLAALQPIAARRPQKLFTGSVGAILTAGLTAFSTISTMTVAHAEEPDPNKYVYLYASAGGYTKKVPDFDGDTLAANSTGDGLLGTNELAAANFGVLHAQATATSDPTSSTYANESATSGAAFGDLVLVSDPDLSPTTMIPTTVTFVLNGNFTLIPDVSSDLSFDNFEKGDVDMTAFWNSVGGPILNENDYEETLSMTNGVTNSLEIDGTLSFTTMLQNDTYYEYQGLISDYAISQEGGEAKAFFSDTAFFNVSSPDPDVSYIGHFGTDYSTLTEDASGAASAPEPSALALVLPGMSAFGLVTARRRRNRMHIS